MTSTSINMIHYLERYGDIGCKAIPTIVGLYALSTGRVTNTVALGVLGGLQDLEVMAIKKTFPKQRPKPYILNITSKRDFESFPSAHTSGAFLSVGFALGMYGTSSPITIAALALSILVGLSRYLAEKHWPSDIVAGAIIGAANGYLASRITI